MNKQPRVNIEFFDTTLRDGAQALPAEHQFPTGSKFQIADHIARLGTGVIEAGFPATPGDKEEVEAVAKSVGQTSYEVQVWGDGEPSIIKRPPVIVGLARAVPADIEATWEAVSPAHRPGIHTFISTDPEHMHAKFPGKAPEQVLAMGSEAVRLACDLTVQHPGSRVEFSAEAASTTDTDFLERVVKEALYQGADVINLPDTVGQRTSRWMYNFYRQAIDWVVSENPAATISAHNHNDLAFAVPNTFALIEAAADYSKETGKDINVQLEATICGLGERAGNADIISAAANLMKHGSELPSPVRFEFNPGQSAKVAQAVMEFAGFDIPRQSPIVGKDTNVHRSGIHSDGVIKGGHQIYTPFDPILWGRDSQAVHENSKYQGKAGKQAAAGQEKESKTFNPVFAHTTPYPV